MTQPRISRRAVLRGIGGIAIGLPLLEEMLTLPVARAATPEVPVRAFNLFFGLGIPAPLQQEGYDGVLEPLKPFSDKLLIMRGIDHVRCDESGINAHYDGAAAAFTAAPPNGEARSGGASIDQAIRRNFFPDSMPPGIVPTLVAGTFFRRSRVSRYVHSYNPDGTVAATMQESPRDLFNRIFGAMGGAGEADVRKQRLNQSVLDSVVGQYKYFQGANSPLGSASKSRVADHLEKIREYELRMHAMSEKDPDAPPLPPRSPLLHGGEADPGGEGIDITLDALTTEWRLMADLYATAIQMDRARFGSLTFLAAGERIRLKGDYVFNGETRFSFDDGAQHNASGANGCSHEWWHKYNPNQENAQLRAHAHMKMRELAYFLEKLNNDDAMDSNGKSILENMLLTISTESGDGRHSDVKRELSGVFHAITSANGRFKTGDVMDVGAEGLDVYNTMLETMATPQKLGPSEREQRPVDSIRA